MKKLLPFVFLLFVQLVHAQAPVSVLKDGDIDKFIKTYKPLVKDLEELNDDWEDMDDPTAMQTMEATAEMQAVFKKHGWDENYWQKFSTIMMAMSYVGMTKEMEEMDASQKAMMEGYLQQIKAQYAASISEGDIAKVKPRYDDILEAIED